jgi:hypothetical protein
MKCFEFKILYSSCPESQINGARRLKQLNGLSPAYLACSVDDLCREILPLVFDDATKCVLDRRIIALYEVMIHEPHSKR